LTLAGADCEILPKSILRAHPIAPGNVSYNCAEGQVPEKIFRFRDIDSGLPSLKKNPSFSSTNRPDIKALGRNRIEERELADLRASQCRNCFCIDTILSARTNRISALPFERAIGIVSPLRSALCEQRVRCFVNRYINNIDIPIMSKTKKTKHAQINWVEVGRRLRELARLRPNPS